MFKIIRPGADVVVVSERPLQALIGLGIWLGVVVIFYAVVLGAGARGGIAPPAGESRNWHDWLLLLFPLFLLPYLFNCLRAIFGAGDLIFDGASRTVSRRRRLLAAFADIRELRLRTVNATCEEFCLSAVLADGRIVSLLERSRSAGVDALAEEIAALIGVKVIRAA